jgi:hypothetical protein
MAGEIGLHLPRGRVAGIDEERAHHLTMNELRIRAWLLILDTRRVRVSLILWSVRMSELANWEADAPRPTGGTHSQGVSLQISATLS